MNWRGSQQAHRGRYLAKCDAAEADRYDKTVGWLSTEDADAYRADLSRVISFRPGMSVLDVGAGTGAISKLLSSVPGLSLSALEPSPAMLARLKSTIELSAIESVLGFSDHAADRTHFAEGQFDVIISRQVGNSLFDPLAAFRNWLSWLAPNGSVVYLDGLYDRSSWIGKWEDEVDLLPLSCCRTTALVPYLLETVGFRIDNVMLMEATNRLPATKTPRFVVVASKVSVS